MGRKKIKFMKNKREFFLVLWATGLPIAAGYLYYWAGSLLSLPSTILNVTGYLAFVVITYFFIKSGITIGKILKQTNEKH
jgi:hypothetical protein